MSLAEACAAVLVAHDTLLLTYAAEPKFPNDSIPGSDEIYEWLSWGETVRDPAYLAWETAMDKLEFVAGDAFPGRHPQNFRPFCQMIAAAPEAFAGQPR